MTTETDFGTNPPAVRTSRLAMIGFGLTVLAVLVLLIAALGYRWGLWDYRFALLTLMKYAAYGAGIAAVISLVGIGRAWPGGVRRGLIISVIGAVVGGYAIHYAYSYWFTVKTVPFIHDITTDTENPPEFVAVVEEREAKGAAAHAYGGPELAAKQRYGYPDLGPFMVQVGQDETFDRALKVAQSMGWDIVDTDKTTGRIEASESTFWYGFTDDIVIRIMAAGDGPEYGSRIDIRCLSRWGRSDLGVNAKRIRAYMEAIEAEFG